jgi:2-polyprenyl-6-methoxyphenol hydroxylase-like FAD-dependent oxidoreductase
LPVAALCLSRYRMDELLAREYQRLGGELRLGRRWRGTMTGEGLVRAAGRMARPLEHGWRWMGVKAHARDLKLEADLEMHLLPHGYVGLCRLAEGRVNVCGLFRRRAGQEQTSTDREEFLRGPAGSSLRRRLATAVFDPGSVCSVAGLSLQPHRAGETDECRVGDALTMIPPITGNGMSMAFESAELAAETLAAYTRGEKDWLETVRSIARRCDACFAGRLAWAAALQKLMFCPALLRGPAAMLLRAKPVWRLLYARTR